MIECQELEKKSLRLVTTNPDWSKLAKECVCFANAYGGKIYIGIENDFDEPPDNQKISTELISDIRRKINSRTVNVNFVLNVKKFTNGGEFIELIINRNVQAIASTSDGRYFIRIADMCKPVLPDELQRLFVDKNAYIWEEQTTKRIPKNSYDESKYKVFLDQIRKSDRVSEFIKNKSDDDILAYYLLTKDDYLTNLGILWIGKRQDRATLINSPIVQFIKYDELEQKVN